MRAMVSGPKHSLIRGLEKARVFLNEKGYTIVDIDFNQIRLADGDCIAGMLCLAKRFEKMSKCDALYLCAGWKNDEFCKIEKQAAELCGLKIIFEEALK